MDTSRWKSILVPREMYEEVKELSKVEGRTISGQLRMVFEQYKENNGGYSAGRRDVREETARK